MVGPAFLGYLFPSALLPTPKQSLNFIFIIFDYREIFARGSFSFSRVGGPAIKYYYNYPTPFNSSSRFRCGGY